jgi:hypothetical protein
LPAILRKVLAIYQLFVSAIYTKENIQKHVIHKFILKYFPTFKKKEKRKEISRDIALYTLISSVYYSKVKKI